MLDQRWIELKIATNLRIFQARCVAEQGKNSKKTEKRPSRQRPD